ncbi:MAG TPA: glycosyltransferase family 4 protein [Gemmatimonadaceae bacterium]|nr:glycosyltransferase family 4 protein [Gemmatimonadaceae bacterium]
MRIAQVAPLYESVPPRQYGGTERVVSYLTEELVRQEHDVTLFAAGDSVTSAKLIPVVPTALRLGAGSAGGAADDFIAPHVLMLEQVAKRARDFDVIHYHIGHLHFPLSRFLRVPHVTTIHGRLDLPELQALFRAFSDVPLVSISNHQRQPIEFANWLATVYHGLPPDLYNLGSGRGNYLAFLGRVSPEKRVDRAIQVAERVGMELRIAAKVDDADRDYFDARIRPMLQHSHVRFIGEITEREKSAFLGDAAALIFPIEWPEPFGLVMVEAMACGTPVIAFRRGSVPEILRDGESGFIVNSVDGAVDAVQKLHTLERARCRRAFEARFLAARMAEEYVAVYRRLSWDHDVAAA